MASQRWSTTIAIHGIIFFMLVVGTVTAVDYVRTLSVCLPPLSGAPLPTSTNCWASIIDFFSAHWFLMVPVFFTVDLLILSSRLPVSDQPWKKFWLHSVNCGISGYVILSVIGVAQFHSHVEKYGFLYPDAQDHSIHIYNPLRNR